MPDRRFGLLSARISTSTVSNAECLDGLNIFLRLRKSLFGRMAFLQVYHASRVAPYLTIRSKSCRLPNHKVRLDGDLFHVFAALFDLIDHRLRRDLPHLRQWLPHRRQTGIRERRPWNVIKADDGNVSRQT